jgi:hypothetical protein
MASRLASGGKTLEIDCSRLRSLVTALLVAYGTLGLDVLLLVCSYKSSAAHWQQAALRGEVQEKESIGIARVPYACARQRRTGLQSSTPAYKR